MNGRERSGASGQGYRQCQRAGGEFGRASSALGSAPLGTLRVFPSIFEERGMREAPPAHRRSVRTGLERSVAPPTQLLAPFRSSPASDQLKSPRASYVLTIRRP